MKICPESGVPKFHFGQSTTLALRILLIRRQFIIVLKASFIKTEKWFTLSLTRGTVLQTALNDLKNRSTTCLLPWLRKNYELGIKA